jgi:ubiquinone/menaquinone biosynthesis C-methylase UbiE
MDQDLEVRAYRDADFTRVNLLCARRALRLAGKVRGHALDLGTGPAEIPIHFCRLAPGWKVTAVDLSAPMLAAARDNLAHAGLTRHIRLLHGDARSLALPAGAFDLVFSNSILHHLEDPIPFWREAWRLVKPGGALLVQDLFRPPSRGEARRLVGLHARDASPILRQLFHQSLLAAFTPAEVRAQVAAAGLRAITVRKVSDRHLVASGRRGRGRR